jgi:hypothetical protein
MSESTSARTSAERAAIERWENEGGRARSDPETLEQIENLVLGGGAAPASEENTRRAEVRP